MLHEGIFVLLSVALLCSALFIPGVSPLTGQAIKGLARPGDNHVTGGQVLEKPIIAIKEGCNYGESFESTQLGSVCVVKKEGEDANIAYQATPSFSSGMSHHFLCKETDRLICSQEECVERITLTSDPLQESFHLCIGEGLDLIKEGEGYVFSNAGSCEAFIEQYSPSLDFSTLWNVLTLVSGGPLPSLTGRVIADIPPTSSSCRRYTIETSIETPTPGSRTVSVQADRARNPQNENIWRWPTNERSYRITGCFRENRGGNAHWGLDLTRNPGSAFEGEDIYAVADGTIRQVGRNSIFGNNIILQTGKYYVQYSHLSSIAVHEGQIVSKQDRIGRGGHTGNSEGPHLDFRVYNFLPNSGAVVRDEQKSFDPVCFYLPGYLQEFNNQRGLDWSYALEGEQTERGKMRNEGRCTKELRYQNCEGITPPGSSLVWMKKNGVM